MSDLRSRVERGGLWIMGAALCVFLAIPLAALFAGSTTGELLAGARDPMVAPALRTSMLTTGASLVIVVLLGTPLAWSLSRAHSRLALWIELLVQLPVVIPPAVAGLAMLLAYGRWGLVTRWLPESVGSLAFSTSAVVLAQVFVSAPFFVQAGVAAFRQVDERLLDVARTLGASPWRVFSRVAVPLAAPGLLAGAVMSWARALGEFGATLMFAGNLRGRTQTLPLAIYTALEADPRAARALSIGLVLVAFTLLVFVRLASSARRQGRGA